MRDLPVVRIFPEWVTSPEQVKSSGRTANFSLWIRHVLGHIHGMLRNRLARTIKTTYQKVEGTREDH
jgi:hypothetical protein